VFSIDARNVQTLESRQFIDTDLQCHQVIPQSDIVITGVPTPNFQVPSQLLKPDAVTINFSAFANFESDVRTKSSYFVPSVGKVTVAMLVRNLVRLYDYQKL
jgi:methylenetetrahydrofolate dehydrogenase (NAD+)